MVDHNEKWAYDESFLWGNIFPQCSNLKQSPVNIDTSDMKECRTLCKMRHKIKESKCFVGYKNKTITIKYSPGSYTIYKNSLYELSEISIHTPSLHSIDGQKFDLEVCLVHKLSDNSSSDSGIMLCCMYESGPDHGKPEQFISQIINHIPSEELNYEKEIEVSKDWTASWLIPESSGYFSYSGSLPYPPCQEGYSVFVYEKIGFIGSTNIETFKRYLGNNSRPTRPLGTRTVFYTPYLKTQNSENKVFRSSNKYLKCYPENVLKTVVPTDPVTTDSTISVEGLSADTLNTLKNVFLSIIILLILVNAFYFTKFLYRHFYVQHMLRMFGGKEQITNDIITAWEQCKGGIITTEMKQQLAQSSNSSGSTSVLGNISGLGSSSRRGLTGSSISSTLPGSGRSMGISSTLPGRR